MHTDRPQPSRHHRAVAGALALGAATLLLAASAPREALAHGRLSHAAARDTLTDGNIIAMEEAGDSAEVVVANVAKRKAKDKAVHEYAERLIKDHSHSLHELRELARKLKIRAQRPADDTTAQMTQHLVDRFNGIARGVAFDSAFVNHEVEDHQHDLAEASDMERAAQNERLKAEIRGSVPVLQKHLDIAQKLAAKWSH